jgi:hypothetical protein
VAPAAISGTSGTPGKTWAATFFDGADDPIGERRRRRDLASGLERRHLDLRIADHRLQRPAHLLDRGAGEDPAIDVGAGALGQALVAWPPSSRVATQVVRRMEL